MPISQRERDESQRRRDEDSKTCKSILFALATHVMGSLGPIVSTVYHRPPENRAEVNAFEEMCKISIAKRPFEGLCAGLATLATLRLAPRLFSRLRQVRRYQLDGSPSSRTPNIIFRGTKLGLDLAASGLVFYYSAEMWCFNPPILAAQVACLPLMEGRSTVSDTMCPVIQQQVARLSVTYWDQNEKLHLRQLGVLANHCSLRQQYENKLRRDQGLGSGSPVSIPPPGVPTVREMIEGKGKVYQPDVE